jgi:hypothetical protein
MNKDLKTAITLVVKELSKKLLVIIGKLSDEKITDNKEYANLWVDCFKLTADIISLIEVREKQELECYETSIRKDENIRDIASYLLAWQNNADVELILRRK